MYLRLKNQKLKTKNNKPVEFPAFTHLSGFTLKNSFLTFYLSSLSK